MNSSVSTVRLRQEMARAPRAWRRGAGMAGMAVAGLLTMSITCVEPHTAFAGNLRAPLLRAWPLSSDPSGRSREFLEAAPRINAPVRPSPACMLGMSATGFDFFPGDKVVAKGQVGTLKTYESSWWTVALDGGGVVKSRPKDLALATVDPAATNPPKPRAKLPASAKKKAASKAKSTATETATRSARAAKAAAKPAAKKAAAKKAAAPAGPPKQAVISPALQRVLDLPKGSPPAPSAPASVESVAKYPDALANVLDAMDSGFQPSAGAKTVAYPPGLSRALGAMGSAAVDKPAARYPDALADILDATEGTGVQGSGKSAVAYPPGLSRVLGATGSAAVDQAAVKYPEALADLLDATEITGAPGAKAPGAKARAPAKKARGTVTKMKSSAARSRGADTKSKSSKSVVAYPPALQRYLDLSASTTAPSPSTSTGSPPFSTTSPRTKKPGRAVYPEVLANLLQLASSTPVPEGSWRKRGAASKKSKSNTATKNRSAKAATSADNRPKSAKLPAALARVLDAAKDSMKLKMLAEVQALGDEVAQYPEALAAYLDLVEMTGVPPSVPPPKRATYPVVLAEALGLGVGLGSGPENSLLLRTPDQSADDLTSLLLAEAQKKGGEASAAYPSALANVLDLSDRGGVAAPVQAVYPAALAHILDLSASGPTQEAPQAYPQALAQLQLDPAEAVAARAEQRDTGASQQEQDKLNLFEKFDRIAQEFARKFGV